jgi:spore coat polysaccharide biosynthesis protein SpsF
VYEELYPSNPVFATADVLELLRKRPELLDINSSIERNEGLRLSIEKYVKESSGE